MTAVPPDIADLVWNYDIGSLDPEAASKVAIFSALRLGSWDQIKRVFSLYGRERVKAVIEQDYFGDRTLPVSVRALWGNVFWPDSPPPELAEPMERWRPTRSRKMDETAVCERLRASVKASGLSQSAFAALLGTSQPGEHDPAGDPVQRRPDSAARDPLDRAGNRPAGSGSVIGGAPFTR